jgi:hypothetical protein
LGYHGGTRFQAARQRLQAMPDTQPNSLRRLGAVLKQAEVKFAFEAHVEPIQALEGVQDLQVGLGWCDERWRWRQFPSMR